MLILKNLICVILMRVRITRLVSQMWPSAFCYLGLRCPTRTFQWPGLLTSLRLLGSEWPFSWPFIWWTLIQTFTQLRATLESFTLSNEFVHCVALYQFLGPISWSWTTQNFREMVWRSSPVSFQKSSSDVEVSMTTMTTTTTQVDVKSVKNEGASQTRVKVTVLA